MLDSSFKNRYTKISILAAALRGYKQDASDRLLCVGPRRNNPGSPVVYQSSFYNLYLLLWMEIVWIPPEKKTFITR